MRIKAKELYGIVGIVKLFLQKVPFDQSLNHIFFYKDRILARNLYSGVVIFHDFQLSHEFSLPFEVLSKMLPLIQTLEFVDIEVSGSGMVWKMGRTRYKSTLIADVEINIPIADADKIIMFKNPTEFVESLGMAEFAVTEDVRQLNLYGVYINSNKIYSCDNVRAYSLELPPVFTGIADSFISYDFCGVLRALKDAPLGFYRENGVLFFMYPNFYTYSSELDIKYPDLERVFKKQLTGNYTKVSECNIENQELTSILAIVKGDRFNNDGLISINTDSVGVFIKSVNKNEDFSTEFSAAVSGPIGNFRINMVLFIELLLRWKNFYVYSNCVAVNEGNTRHIIAKMR